MARSQDLHRPIPPICGSCRAFLAELAKQAGHDEDGLLANVLVGAAAFQRFDPALDGQFSALPIQIFNNVGEPDAIFRDLAAATILVLLFLLLLMTSMAVYLRNRYETKW